LQDGFPRAQFLKTHDGRSGEVDWRNFNTLSVEPRLRSCSGFQAWAQDRNGVLLFAYGFQQAFPVDVWVMKALRELYFRNEAPRTNAWNTSPPPTLANRRLRPAILISLHARERPRQKPT